MLGTVAHLISNTCSLTALVFVQIYFLLQFGCPIGLKSLYVIKIFALGSIGNLGLMKIKINDKNLIKISPSNKVLT